MSDVSPEHFGWLVSGRSRNQDTTLRLYEIIEKNEVKLNSNINLQVTAQELVAVAFSLWRAVFLSDLTGETFDQLADVKKFLVSLISDNSIQYQTDKNARNWSFRYYIDNATYRLRLLSVGKLKIVARSDLRKKAFSEKEEWLNAQSALDGAVVRFENVLQKKP